MLTGDQFFLHWSRPPGSDPELAHNLAALECDQYLSSTSRTATSAQAFSAL